MVVVEKHEARVRWVIALAVVGLHLGSIAWLHHRSMPALPRHEKLKVCHIELPPVIQQQDVISTPPPVVREEPKSVSLPPPVVKKEVNVVRQERKSAPIAEAKRQTVGKEAAVITERRKLVERARSELAHVGSLKKVAQPVLNESVPTPSIQQAPQPVNQQVNLDNSQHALITSLQRQLKFPEYGDVTLLLEIDECGKIKYFEILNATSSANTSYLEQALPALRLPQGKPQKLEVTLCGKFGLVQAL